LIDLSIFDVWGYFAGGVSLLRKKQILGDPHKKRKFLTEIPFLFLLSEDIKCIFSNLSFSQKQKFNNASILSLILSPSLMALTK
jgi:hypothetical protein